MIPPMLCTMQGKSTFSPSALVTVSMMVWMALAMTIWDDIKLCHRVPKGSIFLKIDKNQLSFLFGFYLKKERKKIERKKVRARPLCHPRQPTHEPFRFIGHINASVP